MVVITGAPTPHPLQISFGCCVEGVKRTGQDKRVHAGSISPEPGILAGPPAESGHHPPDAGCVLLTYIAGPLLTWRKCLESERLHLVTRHIFSECDCQINGTHSPLCDSRDVLTLAFGTYPLLGDAGDPHDQSKI